MSKTGHFKSIDEILWSRIDKTVPSGCWLWTGPKNLQGYGQINPRFGTPFPHRLALILETGYDPGAGVYACHKCDVPACCNPSHLYWGTAKDNAADMVKRHRHRNKVITGKAREFVIYAYGRGLATAKELSSLYGVGGNAIIHAFNTSISPIDGPARFRPDSFSQGSDIVR